MKKQSLSIQLISIMTLLVAGTVFVSWLLSVYTLPKVYLNYKKQKLESAYTQIDQAIASGSLDSDEFEVSFERMCANGNLSIMIIDSSTGIVHSSANDSESFKRQYTELLYGTTQKDAEIIKNTSKYIIELQDDATMAMEFLLLWGNCSDGSLIFARTAFSGIEEVADITSRFIGIMEVGALFLSIFVIVLIANRASKSIRELTILSNRMTMLDFDAKYIKNKLDSREIEELGTHMNEMSQTLEKSIGELKTANNQLRKDIQQKEEIDEMRKEFLSNVSHELKTPLAVISGYAEGLKEGISDNPESRDFYCEVIMDEADKMNRMVKQLLDLNSLEFGNNAIEMRRFDFANLLRGTVTDKQILAEQNGVNIQLDVEEQLYIWADEFMVEQVVTNYLTNAIHYAEGEKQVRVMCEKHDHVVRLCVCNTGHQIPEAECERIWEKFYKVDKARTREYGGSGIGLSIVKAIMNSHNQAFGVTNIPNGVMFWCEFDLATEL